MHNYIWTLVIVLLLSHWPGTNQSPYYALTIQSDPFDGVQFHLGNNSYSTPASLMLGAGNYTVDMPTSLTNQGKPYHFVRWTDGPTNSTRIVNLQGNLTIVAHYELTYHRLTVSTDPTGIQFSVDGVNQTSAWSDMLLEGVHIIQVPASVVLGGWLYSFSNWEDSSTNPVRNLDLTTDRVISATYRLKTVVFVTGSQSIHVILVDFADVRHSVTMESIRTKLNAAQSYYQNTSYNQLTINFDTDPSWFALGNSMAYYGAGNFSDEKQLDLVQDTLTRAYSSDNFTSFRRILVIHAGGDQAISHIQNDIWSFAYFSPTLFAFSGNNMRFYVGVVSESDPVGAYAHEIGHTLGLPDLYNITIRTVGGADNLVGPWDLMSQGEYNPNWSGTNPSHLSSWSMMYLGWMPQDEVSYVASNEQRVLVLEPIEKASAAVHTIVVSFGQDLFYLIEARSDPYLPEQGVIIYRVNNATTIDPILVEDANASLPMLSGAAFQFGPSRVPAFIDQSHDVAVIVLDSSDGQYRIMISTAATGTAALAAAHSIYSLINSMKSSGQQTGLSFPQTANEINKAFMAYHSSHFDDAKLTAEEGQVVLQSELKSDSESLIANASSELNETKAQGILFGLIAPDTANATELLLNAEQSHDQGNYITAIQIVKIRFEPAIQLARSQFRQELSNFTYATVVALAMVGIISILFLIRRWKRGY